MAEKNVENIILNPSRVAYIYIYMDNSIPVYVGKCNAGSSLERRIRQHRSDPWYRDDLDVFYTPVPSSADADMGETAIINEFISMGFELANIAKTSWGRPTRLSYLNYAWEKHTSFRDDYADELRRIRAANIALDIRTDEIDEFLKTSRDEACSIINEARDKADEIVKEAKSEHSALVDKCLELTTFVQKGEPRPEKIRGFGFDMDAILFFYWVNKMPEDIFFTSKLLDEFGNILSSGKIFCKDKNLYCVIDSDIKNNTTVNKYPFALYDNKRDCFDMDNLAGLPVAGRYSSWHPSSVDAYKKTLHDAVMNNWEGAPVSGIFNKTPKRGQLVCLKKHFESPDMLPVSGVE